MRYKKLEYILRDLDRETPFLHMNLGEIYPVDNSLLHVPFCMNIEIRSSLITTTSATSVTARTRTHFIRLVGYVACLPA